VKKSGGNIYADEALELERRRFRAVQKVVDGATQTSVAKEFGVALSAVNQWMSMYREHGWDGLKARPRPGRPIIFTEEHSRKLFEIIEKSPYTWGYESDLWTVQMARDVLHVETGVHFSTTRILSGLHELGFSFQKPQLKALEKKTEKVEQWLSERYPQIENEANAVGAAIYFEDESGISLNTFTGRTWARKGTTPVVYRSGQRTKRTMAAAMSTDGRLYFETYSGGTSGERYKSFLEHLNGVDNRLLIVIHDGLPSHRSKIVTDYVASTNGKMKLFQLPGYSPELNPGEWIWDNLKKRLGKRAHLSLEDLTEHGTQIMNEIKNNPSLIQDFYNHVYA